MPETTRAGLRGGETTPEGALTRARILREAARLFRTRGYHATTIRAISERVGILSGSLFHHFKSKQQMLVEIIRDASQSMCIRAEQESAATSSPRERLQRLIRLELDCLLAEDTKDSHAVLVSEWREVDESAKQGLTALRRRYFAIWREALEQCQREGLLRIDPAATQFALHGAITWTNTWFKSSGRFSLGEYAILLERLALAQDNADGA